MMHCNNCGTINDEDSIFCKKCGNNLNDKNLDDSYTKDSKKNNNTKVRTKTKVKTKTKTKKVKEKQKKTNRNNKDVKIEKEMSLFQKILMFLLIIICIVLFSALSVCVYYIWDSKSVKVPNVVNLSYEDAELTLAKSDLETIKKTEKVDDENLNGIVINQNKKEGTKVSRKSKIKVIVGVYEKEYILQNFINMNINEVKNILDLDGMKYKITYEEVNDKDSNIVLSQKPKANTKIKPGELVELVVSKKIIKEEKENYNSEQSNDDVSDEDNDKQEDESDTDYTP